MEQRSGNRRYESNLQSVKSRIMATTLKASAQRVQDALAALGFTNQVVEPPASTRTSAEAAAAVGCTVGQIAKSLIFQGRESGQAMLVIASGANRVNEKQLSTLLGDKLQKPDAEFVRSATGFVIGGVPPVGHPHPLLTLIDQDLWQYDEIWAAAGHPNAVFKLTPDELVRMTGGRVVAVR
jgi:prolyl-tRNA editing enzyme YbaK/EbsC (Cys-tRNA(Pro) deacylase)